MVGSPQSGASPALMFKYHNDYMMRLTMTMMVATTTMTINLFFGGFCEFDFVHAGEALVGASTLRPQMSGLKPKNWSAFTDLIFINLGQQ